MASFYLNFPHDVMVEPHQNDCYYFEYNLVRTTEFIISPCAVNVMFAQNFFVHTKQKNRSKRKDKSSSINTFP